MEIISLVAFFFAMFIGVKLIDYGIGILDRYIEGYDHALPIVSFVLIFVASLLVLHAIGKMLKTIVNMTLLGGLDDAAGGLLGIAKWALFASFFFWIFFAFGGTISDSVKHSSLLFEPITSLAPWLFGFFSNIFPYFMDYFDQTNEIINQTPISV